MSTEMRKAIYGLVAAVVAALAVADVVFPGFGAQWLPLFDAGLGAVVIGYAAYKAKRLDYTYIYSGLSAVLVALGIAGVLEPRAIQGLEDILVQVIAVIGAAVAFSRTDTSTRSGAPASEVGTITPAQG